MNNTAKPLFSLGQIVSEDIADGKVRRWEWAIVMDVYNRGRHSAVDGHGRVLNGGARARPAGGRECELAAQLLVRQTER